MRNIGHVYPKRIRHAYINEFIIIYSFVSLGVISVCKALIFFLSKKNTIVFRLNQALKTDKLNIVYQPILSIKDKKVIGVEALLRWYDNEYGRVSPLIFLFLLLKSMGL